MGEEVDSNEGIYVGVTEEEEVPHTENWETEVEGLYEILRDGTYGLPGIIPGGKGFVKGEFLATLRKTRASYGRLVNYLETLGMSDLEIAEGMVQFYLGLDRDPDKESFEKVVAYETEVARLKNSEDDY
tara:strand:- start:601 stop:987 length:387 start_codon:yes stop_codon:yes gene_type:complete